MKLLTIEEVKKDLSDVFDIDNNLVNGSYINDDKFGISKKQMERPQVLTTLMEYFKDKNIIGGYCKVDDITFVHTCFEIKEGNPYKQ